MLSFKQFLVESKQRAHKYSTKRANAADVKTALEFTSKVLGIPVSALKDDLIGSAKLTLMGRKKDSGDIDIAVKTDDVDDIHQKMLKAVNGEGVHNAGTKVGSYSVPIGDKHIQVDLMFVKNKDWAKWIYGSEHGAGSKYPGAVRNIILMTALAHTQEPGKDFVHRDSEGKPVVRASKSIKMDSGMERLFKMAKYNKKTGRYNKGIEKVKPEQIEAHLKDIGSNVKFSHDPDITDNPDHVAAHVFGKGVRANLLTSAENVIRQIHNIKNLNLQKTIIAACKSELKRLKLPIPVEL